MISELGQFRWARGWGGVRKHTLPTCGSSLISGSPAPGPHANTSSVGPPVNSVLFLSMAEILPNALCPLSASSLKVKALPNKCLRS